MNKLAFAALIATAAAELGASRDVGRSLALAELLIQLNAADQAMAS